MKTITVYDWRGMMKTGNAVMAKIACPGFSIIRKFIFFAVVLALTTPCMAQALRSHKHASGLTVSSLHLPGNIKLKPVKFAAWHWHGRLVAAGEMTAPKAHSVHLRYTDPLCVKNIARLCSPRSAQQNYMPIEADNDGSLNLQLADNLWLTMALGFYQGQNETSVNGKFYSAEDDADVNIGLLFALR